VGVSLQGAEVHRGDFFFVKREGVKREKSREAWSVKAWSVKKTVKR